MASVQDQAEVDEKVEGIEDAEIDRAEADEEVRKPKPAARLYTHVQRCTSTKSPIYIIAVGANIVRLGGD